MAAESANTEFQLWLKAVSGSVTAVEECLAETPINTEDLADNLEDMLFAIPQLEKYRPVSNQKLSYDFTTAIPVLVSAKQLEVKAKRKLPKTDEKPTQVILSANSASKKIPEVKIAPFDGDITKFSSFITAFEMKYDDLPISKKEKLLHLRDHVINGPLKVIESLAITDDNYDRAISDLKSQYNHQDEIVSALYRKLDQVPIATNNPHSLSNTYYDIQGILSALEAHNQSLDDFPPLRDSVYSRYPTNVIQQICVNERLPVKRLQAEILKMAQFRLKLEAARAKPSHTQPQKQTHGVSASLTATKNEKPVSRSHTKVESPQQRQIPPCAFCNQIHYSASCTKYVTLDSRLSLIKDRCSLCLKSNHTKNTCRRQITCHYCKQVNSHHSSLCPQQFGKQAEANSTGNLKTGDTSKPIEQEASSSESKASFFVRTHKGAHITAQVTIENPDTKRRYRIRALLDTGSNESYISESAARRMGFKLTNQRNVPVSVFLKNNPVNLATATTTFILTNNDEFRIPVVVDTSPAIPQQVHLFDYKAFKDAYPKHASKKFIDQGNDSPIELLIGSDYYYDMIEEKITVDDGLYLNATKFGWMLVGRQPCEGSQRATYFQMSPAAAVQELCSLESLGITEMPLSRIEEEERALNQFYENLKFVNNRYEIRWPWKQFPPDIPNNFGLAMGRLRSLHRKLTEETFNQYNAILEQQIANGIIEDVPPDELADTKYFLPHHVIVTPEKSTQSRVVYDGSAKTPKSNCINDQMYKGRNLLANSGKIIIRFRLRRIAVFCDLEKAYHALAINRADANYVCFLWIWKFHAPLSGINIRILRFLRVVFGIVASAFLLLATIWYHLKKYKRKFAKFVKRLKEDGFVDNFITGFSTLLEAIAFYNFAVKMFQDCSMNLRKWASNSEELRSKFEQPDKSAAISVLGIIWNQYTDKIHLKRLSESEVITLRMVLSTTAQFYDPCGWWSPILLTAKTFLREIHQTYKWDDPLNDIHQNQWLEIQAQLQLAAATSMDRLQCTVDDETAHYSLHVFTDASIKACAAAVYLRKESEGNIETYLLFSKTKLAKITNVPKLELIAVLLGIKALQYVRDAVEINCRLYLWCDAKCVLNWIMSDKILPLFIQRQVQYIRDVPSVEKRYVTSQDNAADLPSRGAVYCQVTERWFHGPKWLCEADGNWPPALPVSSPDLDAVLDPQIPKTIAVITTPKYPFDLDPSRYSTFMKLIRVTVYVMRFLSKFKVAQRHQIFTGAISNFTAQQLWIKQEQENHYHDVIVAINERKKHDLVLKLNLYQNNGIIRCAGRFKHAPLSPDERSPILLPPPKSSKFVALLIEFYHAAAFHAGTSSVLASIRRKYWIPAGRRAVQNILRACKQCKRYTARPYQQPQHSDVPAFRFDEHGTPFQNIGIDTFGPIWSSDEKRYVLLVTDLVIRAVDLEMLEDMSADRIFLALRLVIARRTRPNLIVSDNAPQFKATETALTKIYTHEWSWKFIPEHSPWEGGAYERLVGLSKAALLRTFHNRGITDTVLRTTLAEITHTLNDRPLTYVSNDRNEAEPLTPNHFLKSYFKQELVTPSIQTSGNLTISERQLITIARCCEANTDQIWSEWKTHYLQYLREKGFHRNETFQRQTSLMSPKINSIVLIAERNIKRSAWKLGRVIRLNNSADGKVRSVMLQTVHGVLVRPLTEVYPLELSTNDETYDSTATASIPAAAPIEHQSDDEWDNPEIIEEEIFVD